MTTTADSEVWPPSVVFNNVSWSLYQKLLKAVGEQNLRLTYDEGVLEIMSPLAERESAKKLIGRFIESMTLELNIPMCSLGSTTFKRKSLLKGREPDECYYIEHERDVRGKKRLDLQRDPPPDLALEVDLSYRTVDKRRIYAAMRVPEIWSYDTGKLEFLHFRRGKYEARQTSLSFPFLSPTDIVRFLNKRDESFDETSIVRFWSDWVRKSLSAHIRS
jgi:Uma2 family endonuclease